MISGKYMIIQILLGLVGMIMVVRATASLDYGIYMIIQILFFEGQRSGKLPSIQRMIWKDSALRDGSNVGASLSIYL